jgi:hypothetical protein
MNAIVGEAGQGVDRRVNFYLDFVGVAPFNNAFGDVLEF